MIFDIVVFVALLISAVIAFLRGFIREILTILGVTGGLLAAWFAGPLFATHVREWISATKDGEQQRLFGMIPYDLAADLLAYGLIFIIVVLILSLISHFLSGWAKALGLGALDRTLGVIFGIVRGVVLLALLYLPVQILVDRNTRIEWFGDSKTRLYVETTSEWLIGFLPESMMEKTGEKAESMADEMREKFQEIDVLPKDNKLGAGAGTGTGARAGAENKEAGAGYKEEQRQDLNQLIEGEVGNKTGE